MKASARDPVAMARACREVIAADADRPFFLYLATIDPHRGPGVGPAPLRANRFGNEEAPAEPDAVRYNPEEVVVPAWLPDTPACRAELVEYYESVSRVDAGLGALIDELKTAGEWNNTLLVYLSDHGIAMQGAKTTLYEPGMRSPLVVRHPASSRGGERADELVSWTDLTPTLLDAAGVLSHGDVVDATVAQRVSGRRRPFQGRSFLPLITAADLRPHLVIERRRGDVRATRRRLRIAHVPRGHHVLPDAGGARGSLQAHLERCPPAAVPVRFGPVGLGDVADAARAGARRAVRTADG